MVNRVEASYLNFLFIYGFLSCINTEASWLLLCRSLYKSWSSFKMTMQEKRQSVSVAHPSSKFASQPNHFSNTQVFTLPVEPSLLLIEQLDLLLKGLGFTQKSRFSNWMVCTEHHPSSASPWRSQSKTRRGHDNGNIRRILHRHDRR